MTITLAEETIKLAEEVMADEDLRLQVLLSLPAKSLVRFKSVSKHWLSIISNPKFCSKHTHLHPKSSTLGFYFAYDYTSELRSVSLNKPNRNDLPTLTFINNSGPIFDSDQGSICHACNGLFLCANSVSRPYFVCNITTHKSTVLPQHPLPSSRYYHPLESASLVFDPSKSTHFKVVLFNVVFGHHDTILHRDDGYESKSGKCSHWGCYEMDIYSSETGVWERMYFQAPVQDAKHRFHLKAVCDGILHWVTEDKCHGSFDVDAAKLSFIPVPPKPKSLDVQQIRYFGESGGHLYLIFIWNTTKEINVFELDKSNWTEKYSVNMDSLKAAYPDCQWPQRKWIYSVLSVVKEEETDDFDLLLSLPDKIVSYNLKRNTFKVLEESPIQEHPLLKRSYAFIRSFPFMGDESGDCVKFAKYYRALCRGDLLVDKWNEQRETGTFAGTL